MADRPLSDIIKDHPIGSGLDRFRASFNTICGENNILPTRDALNQLDHDDLKDLSGFLLASLQSLLITDHLLSKTKQGTLRSDLSKLISAVTSEKFEFDRIWPLVDAAIVGKSDREIWDHVYNAVTEFPCYSEETDLYFSPPEEPSPRSHFFDSSEYLYYLDRLLEREIGPVYVGLPDFHKTFLGDVPGLETTAKAFFEQCVKDSNPFFDDGWRGWPRRADSDAMLGWLSNFCEKLSAFAESYASFFTHQRTLLAKPGEPIDGDMEVRKMDIGFVNKRKANKGSRSHWTKIMVPVELKSDPAADGPSEAWLDLGRDAKKVFHAQKTRRFVLGFTLCGSLMRVWEFDRSGGTTSDQFDINVDGLRFASTILGFLGMSEEQLGYDPTVITSESEQYMEIERNGRQERLIIDEVLESSYYINGQATICWKAHPEGDAKQPLVIKDSWHPTYRKEEGKLFEEVTNKGLANVARYYHHETVRVSGKEDDVNGNVRKGMDVTKAVREISYWTVPNRVHRRVILRDYGKPIFKASSPVALLTALEGCIEGHELLFKAGILHGDISVTNLIINEDENNPSYPSFLIDLDKSLREPREDPSGRLGRLNGTPPFMAILALGGHPHTLMYDLESFFWVLFWICTQYEGPGIERERHDFLRWNYMNIGDLAYWKTWMTNSDITFEKVLETNVTPYYCALRPCLTELRRVVYPDNQLRKTEDLNLYSAMKKVLQDARKYLRATMDPVS